ncbi:hypothetical protein SAMN05216378_0810 [Paenibacillus catalpae]|uniref:Uncharacterized protein n=1 Tax=Paenibacillus catalpae TaxID=1045775 RepID=A0A1I1U0X7_9BACL|nr:hypothetical protein SAMN05216378_0810 [Paenibacillus catalpae]
MPSKLQLNEYKYDFMSLRSGDYAHDQSKRGTEIHGII